MTDAFLGTWILDADQNDYTFGPEPQAGTYVIAAQDAGYHITMAWTTPAGEAHEMAYDGTPDGKRYPADAPGFDAMSMTRVDDHTLDSAAYVGEQRIAYARRVLSADQQTMTVTQSGNKPDGTAFTNTSVYQRQTT